MATEDAKIALAEAEVARIALSQFTGGPNPLATRLRFNEAVAAPAGRIKATLQTLLAQAGLHPRDIGTVFMTGGSSGLPILRACVSDVLPGVPIATGDMLGSVGTGLALEAVRRFG